MPRILIRGRLTDACALPARQPDVLASIRSTLNTTGRNVSLQHGHAQKDGFFRRVSDQTRIQRFRCPHCRRTFSAATFTTTYWLRLRHLFLAIGALSVEGGALRQITRLLHISRNTVLRHLARAGRHCLPFHQQSGDPGTGPGSLLPPAGCAVLPVR